MEVDVHDELIAGAVGLGQLPPDVGGAVVIARPSLRFSPAARATVGGAVLLALTLAAEPAFALTVDLAQARPSHSVVGQAHTFMATVTGAVGAVTYEWDFGDGEILPGGPNMARTFATVGTQFVWITAKDASGETAQKGVPHLVHHPLTARAPTSSTSIVFDERRGRVYSVNQDNDTVTAVDAERLTKLGEVEVFRRPESLALMPDGKIWVVHQDDYAVAVIDPDGWKVEGGFRLPYASQPVGIAVSPTGDAVYVTLMAYGKLLKLDPRTGIILGEVDVGPRPRGIAVSHDGKDVFVTRFISPDSGGEIIKVDAGGMRVSTTIVLPLDTTTEDSDQRSRGVPNYLFSIALTPDGRQAWVPGKKDNIVRGKARDGQNLTHDTTVRPLAAAIDVVKSQEIFPNRVDLDDRSLPIHATFSPFGNLVFLTLGGSHRIEIRDIHNPTLTFSAIANIGNFPRAAVITPHGGGRLFVQAALSRDIWVYDLSATLAEFRTETPPQLAVIPAVANEKVPAEILKGKRIFHDSADRRMANEGYLSCGTCHFEGIDDGRVFDFTDRGEGLRNTPALLGRNGTRHGRLNWTANFDEVQDFEHQIRDLFGGRGFIPDEVYASGTHNQPFGAPKARLSADLDALAAYITSLEHVNPSPYRNADGSLTEDGIAGKALFEKLGCDFCHGASGGFTDSARGLLHDVGTLGSKSGSRMGGTLVGIDTPTLLGVWETPPYLHDGSAATIRDVLTSKNSKDLHGYVSALSPREIDQLVAYVLQIDEEMPVRRLPFEGEPPTGSGSSGKAGCGVSAGDAGRKSPLESAIFVVVGVIGAFVRGRRRRRETERGGIAVAVLAVGALLATACSPSDSSGGGREPTDWSNLPALAHPDPELAALGLRQETIDRICARGRDDAFAQTLCARGRRLEIRDLNELLELLSLAEDRAFALTGNSTSLVATSVSAINPRMIVFPRVGADLLRPETMTAVGFVRGEQFVELVSRDRETGDYNFYLLSFEQKCSYEGGGCDLASLFTEEIEHKWTAYSVYDQDDLEPTTFDCLSCHAPAAGSAKRILRMQELDSPWLHWFPQRFVQRTETDRVLVAQFADAHGDDGQYGGIPVATIVNALDEGSGAQLEALLRAEMSANQPNAFDGHIATEMERTGSSPTWQSRFDTHLRGEAIAVPYPRIDVTDEAKRLAAVRSYRDVVRGAAGRNTMPDIRDIFSTDAKEKLSFVPSSAADGKTVLLQMCARCHDGRGNPQLSRNRFNVRRLAEMPRAAKDLAITRLAETGIKRMPPWRVGTLTADNIRAATAELQK